MSKSLKTNYLFNLLNTVSGLLFPLITFPYASRILLADGIGQVNFFQSIIQYITLLTSLGIPMYATREIAKVRNNKDDLSKTSLEILILHGGLTLLGYVVVTIICLTVAKIQADIPLFLLLSVSIFFTAIGCEWFYQGTENFKYITIRSLVVKLISIVLLFILVKTKEDLFTYASISIIGIVGSNIFNFVRFSQSLNLTVINIYELHPSKHLKPCLKIFSLNLVVSLYVHLNTVMLGFLKDAEAVGLYTAATKINQMIIGFLYALGTVLLPRLTNLLSLGKNDDFKVLSEKGIQLMIALVLPLTAGVFITAPYLITLFCGVSYVDAISTLRILSFLITIISISYMLNITILYPQGQEVLVLKSTCIGALINLILNYYLISYYGQNGAAIASLCSEFTVLMFLNIIGRKYIHIKWLNIKYFKYLSSTVVMIICIYIVLNYFHDLYLRLFISIVIGFVTYLSCLIILNDDFLQDLHKQLTHRKL